MRIDWKRAKENVQKCFTNAHTEKVRVETKVLKYLLLWHGDTSTYAGHAVKLKKRNLGAGVYEIWMEETK